MNFSFRKPLPSCAEYATEEEVGIAEYPVGVDLQTLVKWRNLVETFSLEWAIGDLSIQGATAIATLSDISGDEESSDTPTEQELACESAGVAWTIASQNPSDVTAEGEAFSSLTTLSVQLFRNSTGGYRPTLFFDGMFYPYLAVVLDLSLQAQDYSAGQKIVTFSNSAGEEEISIPMEIDGVTFNYPIFRTIALFDSGTGCTVSDNFTGVPIILTPTEFRPYDPGDGLGPIVDTATGEILRQL